MGGSTVGDGTTNLVPKRKLNADTVAIINAIENATGAAKVVADAVAKELVLHTQHDDERFEALSKLVESVAQDVKSLLDSRTFLRGAWWAVGGMVLGVVGLVTAAYHYLVGK